MWTERKKVLTSITEIKDYIETMNFFHDYRLGNISFMENENSIMIEEDINDKSNDTAHIWDFRFGKVEELKVSMDMFLSSFINEIEINDYCLFFSLTNGYISFKATEFSLGIPMI